VAHAIYASRRFLYCCWIADIGFDHFEVILYVSKARKTSASMIVDYADAVAKANQAAD
jgi:hypothetical protein